MLIIEVTTDLSEDGEAYVHEVPEDTSKIDIVMAISTLYGPEGVTDIRMFIREE